MVDPLYLYVLPDLPAFSAKSEEQNKSRRASCAVIWTRGNGYQVFCPTGFRELQRTLRTVDEVIGFGVAESHYGQLFKPGRSGVPVVTDLCELLSRHGQEPVSLRSVASATFGNVSLLDDEKLIELWSAREHERVIRACKRRVGLIRKVHEHVVLHHQFRFYDKDGDNIRTYMDSGVVPSGRFPDERQLVQHWNPAACDARARKLRRAVAAFRRTGKLPKY